VNVFPVSFVPVARGKLTDFLKLWLTWQGVKRKLEGEHTNGACYLYSAPQVPLPVHTLSHERGDPDAKWKKKRMKTDHSSLVNHFELPKKVKVRYYQNLILLSERTREEGDKLSLVSRL
jgi:hypothetical protein